MMTARRRQTDPGLRLGFALTAVLCVGYAVMAARLFPTGVVLKTKQVSSAFSTTVADQVPSSAVQSIADHLGSLQGRNPELVVSPAPTGSGYDVSTTVDLGENASVPASTWTATVKRDVPIYFQGVFQSGEPVVQAQVYFTVGGHIVAGAALGEASYQALSVSSTAGGGGWLAALSSLPPVTGQGASDRWFEMASGLQG